MNKAGGIIGIIAGVFGFLASIATFFMGGISHALDATAGTQILTYGWGGLLCTFGLIVFSAIAINSSRLAGLGMLTVSIAGIVYGGTLVAICMGLGIIASLLCCFSAKENLVIPIEQSRQSEPEIPSTQLVVSDDYRPDFSGAFPQNKAGTDFTAIAITAIIVIGVVMVVGLLRPSGSTQNQMEKISVQPEIDDAKQAPSSPISDSSKQKAQPQIETVQQKLENPKPSTLQPSGELYEIFRFGSDYTDLQRDKKLEEIKGQIVEWSLPVYEVGKEEDGSYKIQTGSDNSIDAFVYVVPANADEIAYLESLKTGQVVEFRGVIDDVTFRMIDIKPAKIILPKTEQKKFGRYGKMTSDDSY